MKLKKMMALVLCATTVAGLGLTGCGNSSDVRMVPVQEVLSSSCLELKRKMKQARKRT